MPLVRQTFRVLLLALVIANWTCAIARAELIWIEGEKPTKSTMNRHPWWYDQVKKDQLSGGDWISNFDEKKAGEAEYTIAPKEAGKFAFWVRANPVAVKLSYQLNNGKWTEIPLEGKTQGMTNIAADDKIDLRFIAWAKVADIELPTGKSTIHFRMESNNSNHGALDCFVLTNEPFVPKGKRKPGEDDSQASSTSGDWFTFVPPEERFDVDSLIDLRRLNEKTAGDGGRIIAKEGRFFHSKSNEPVRFWAVNGPATDNKESLEREARVLARYGVNLVRRHKPIFDEKGNVDPAKIQESLRIVEAMKKEGIYTHFSIYFPLWLRPTADCEFLKGYDGTKNPFAALFFNETFQERYRQWWKALLTTPSETTGKRLIDDPAVMSLELQNEDSFFFWTFNSNAVPDAQLKIIEKQFGDWLKKKYGTLAKAQKAWGDSKSDRDAWNEGRVGFRPLWNIANERTSRDKDSAQFLYETQNAFYRETTEFLRKLGYVGLITYSNWHTASPEYFGPIEKLTYAGGDFVDRHGYFGCENKGEAAEWSLRDGHTYVERSALRFENEGADGPAVFANPAIDPQYDERPSMISETTFNRPNRFRSEAPLYFAAYGSLQESDAIVHFAWDGKDWSAKPGYFMQPWTVASPAMLGQFPVAAMIYRKGLIRPGDILADIALAKNDVTSLAGTPLPQDAALDELRLKDVPQQIKGESRHLIDPLIHYAGRTKVRFTDEPEKETIRPLMKLIDREKKKVTSSTQELELDYANGLLRLNAPQVQGASGNLKLAGTIKLADLEIEVPLDLGHIVVMSLDEQPLAKSRRMLLQVMSEERTTGFESEQVEGRRRRIVSIGGDTWDVRKLAGEVRLTRSDAAKLVVRPLDNLGVAGKQQGDASKIQLAPTTLYYVIEQP